MIKVCIIGSGNVAQHLIKAFAKSDQIAITQVFSRHKDTVASLIESDKITDDLTTLAKADLYIIAISDDVIGNISSKFSFTNQLVVHTSGSVSMNDLNTKNRKGVFYPLQTFSKNKEVDFKIIPICLEAENDNDFKLLEKVARSISDSVYSIDSEQRKALHIAAVFVNNFVNHLYQIGDTICKENKIPFEILKPLIQETAQKIISLSPENAQTGPAKRNDTNTIAAHSSFLTDENQKNLYTILTQSIQNNG